ncbi:MAG: hypothetical protein ABSG84_18955 [Acidobacteriaceae bacterium]
MHSLPPEQTDSTDTDPTRRYRCRHVFTDGHRCGSPSLRSHELCYYHHASRREPSLAPGHGRFFMPRIDDRPAIQIAIYDILARVTLGDIDLKTAGMLFYGLQIASSNLTQYEKSLRNAASNSEPLVEDIVTNPFLGDLAPIAEYVQPAAPPAQTPAPRDRHHDATHQQHRNPPPRQGISPQHPQSHFNPSNPASSPHSVLPPEFDIPISVCVPPSCVAPPSSLACAPA